MAVPFSKSLTAIRLEKNKSRYYWLAAAIVLLTLWFLWFFSAPIAVYRVSQSARLEVRSDVQPIHALVSGRVVSINMTLGENVAADQLLLTLDSKRLQIQLEESEGQLRAIRQEALALQGQIKGISDGVVFEKNEVVADLNAARARLEEAKTVLQFSQDRLTRVQSLYKTGDVSDIELNKARVEQKKFSSTVAALQNELTAIDSSGSTKQVIRRVHIQELKTDLARVERERVGIETDIRKLHLEIRERNIRAPFAGRVGELANLYPGMQVKEGQRLGVFVPQGRLKVEAYFLPGESLGHVKKGQEGRLLLDGFPWTQYGSGRVTVSDIAEEIRDGLVEVQLEVDMPENTVIPLQHGMPATVEIEIEKALPVELVLRAVGKTMQKKKQ